jgi:hypothetical protein
MPTFRRFSRALAIAWMVLLAAGCAGLELPAYEPKPLDAYSGAERRGGLGIAVAVLDSEDENVRYFGRDLVAAGIRPVLVMAENRHVSASYTVARDAMGLEVGHGSHAASDAKLDWRTGTGTLAVGGALLLSPIALGIAGKDISNVMTMNHQMRSQEFHTRTLAPGERAHGFVYFRIPPGPPRATGPWRLHVQASEPSGASPERFTFTLKGREP